LDRKTGLRKIIDVGSNAAAEFEDLPTDDSGTKHRNYLAPGDQIPLEEGDSPWQLDRTLVEGVSVSGP
jgi:hypothetical protein